MKKLIYSTALLLTLSLGACSANEDLSPQEILNNAMQETTDLSSYYAEYAMDFGDGTTTLAKQWVKGGKVRSEVEDESGETSYAVNDGEQLISYMSGEQTATAYDLNAASEGFIQPTLREQMMGIYNNIKETHTITFGDDTKIAGHDTYHLIAKSKEQETLFGDMEFWIDKKTWMPLKSIMVTADMTSTTEYTTYEPNAKIDDAVFTLELPEDVVVEQQALDLPTSMTIDEAKAFFGEFLVFPESSGYSIDSIENMHTDTNEMSINYVKDDALQFSMSMFKPTEPLDVDNAIAIRGTTGTTDDLGFPFLQWEENGVRYNVMFEDDVMTYEQFVELAKQMEMVK